MVRIHGLLVALGVVVAGAGCRAPETVLRLTVAAGTAPAPAALRLTLSGAVSAPPRMVAPVALPGTVVVHGLPAAAATLCVQVDALDTAGALVGQAAATVTLAPHHDARASAVLAPPGADTVCPAAPGDLGAPGDGGMDLGGGADGGPDAAVPSCPASALFCDDFESDDLTRWDFRQVKYPDMGSIARSMARAAHGRWSTEATASGMPGAQNYATLEKDFAPGLAPPLALRVNVWSAQPLGSYTMVMSLFDQANAGLSIGGNNDRFWAMTEYQDQTGATDDHPSDMVPTTGGQWHCIEVLIDGAGNVSGWVDGHRLIGPFPRAVMTTYTAFVVGVVRSVVNPAADVFVDDVAIGPSRLYCP